MFACQVFDKFIFLVRNEIYVLGRARIFLVCNEIYVLGRAHQNDVNRFRLIFVGGSESDKFGYCCVSKNRTFIEIKCETIE